MWIVLGHEYSLDILMSILICKTCISNCLIINRNIVNILFLVLIAVTCETWAAIFGFPGFWFSGQEGHEMPTYFSVWPEKPCFYGQVYLKTLALTGLTRLFQATFSWQARQDLGKPGLARLGRAYHAFDHTSYARAGLRKASEYYCHT